jgi:hypothetical protein
VAILTSAHHELPVKVEDMISGLPSDIVDAIATVYDLGYAAGEASGIRIARDALEPWLTGLAAKADKHYSQLEDNAQIPEAPLPDKWDMAIKH